MKLVSDLAEKLMLTAGNAENDPCVPGNGVDESVVGGGVAGVERYDHIGVVAGVVGNISAQEIQTFVAEILSDLAAKGDDVGLEVETDDLDGKLLLQAQLIIEGKGQVSLAAAKINDAQRALACLRFRSVGQSRKDIIHDFEKSVDLAEFAVMLGKDAAVCAHDAQADEEIAGLAIGDDVILFAVVGKADGRNGKRGSFAADARIVDFVGQNLCLHLVVNQRIQTPFVIFGNNAVINM